MPNRIIRDGILTSERIVQLSWPAEVFYRRLMSVVDDYGRYSANLKLLRSACYPLQIDKVTDADVGKWLTDCVTADLVSVYPAQDGKRYLEMRNFGQQVRTKSKYPAPPESTNDTTKTEENNSDPIAGDDRLHGKCNHLIANDIKCNQMIANDCLVGGGGEDEGGGGGGGERPRARTRSLSHVLPSREQVMAHGKALLLPEWVCEDFWLKHESMGWEVNGNPIRNWKALMARCKVFWESDGKPQARPIKDNGKGHSGASTIQNESTLETLKRLGIKPAV